MKHSLQIGLLLAIACIWVSFNSQLVLAHQQNSDNTKLTENNEHNPTHEQNDETIHLKKTDLHENQRESSSSEGEEANGTDRNDGNDGNNGGNNNENNNGNNNGNDPKFASVDNGREEIEAHMQQIQAEKQQAFLKRQQHYEQFEKERRANLPKSVSSIEELSDEPLTANNVLDEMCKRIVESKKKKRKTYIRIHKYLLIFINLGLF